MEHEWLTTAEVAEIFRVKPATVADWCNKGRYSKKHLRRTNGNAKGSKWLIHRDALKPKPTQQQYISQEERARQSRERALALFSSKKKT